MLNSFKSFNLRLVPEHIPQAIKIEPTELESALTILSTSIQLNYHNPLLVFVSLDLTKIPLVCLNKLIITQ